MNFAIQSTFAKNKSINWTIGLSTLSFLLLFHKTGLGINLAIFDLLILAFWLATDTGRFKEPQIIITAIATMVTAGCTAWYGTPDTVIWSIICLTWLSQQMLYPENSFLFFETKSFINIFTGPLTALAEFLTLDKEQVTNQKLLKGLFVVVVPLFIAILFAAFYSNFNPFFEKGFQDLINMLDFSMILTLLLGTFFSLYIFKAHLPAKLNFFDQVLSNDFNKNDETGDTPKSTIEKQAGLSLFGILNLVLIIFLVSDIAFVNKLSNGVGDNYSQYVHQGVGMLIFSIVLATSFILYFFRGHKFSSLPNSSWLKRLALLWMALNIIMLFTTGFKNLFYVIEYGLTLKRIGVFVYLSMAGPGLAIAFLKVFKGRTNAYLFRNLYWSFFMILTVNLCMDWSTITARFNIHENIKDHRNLDWNYLLTLNERTVPILIHYQDKLRLGRGEQENLRSQLVHKNNNLKNYTPEWREMSLAKQNAKNEIK